QLEHDTALFKLKFFVKKDVRRDVPSVLEMRAVFKHAIGMGPSFFGMTCQRDGAGLLVNRSAKLQRTYARAIAEKVEHFLALFGHCFLRDNLSSRLVEDACAPHVVAVKMCVDNVAHRELAEFSKLVEAGARRFQTLRSVDHHHTGVGDDEKHIAERVVDR